MKRSLSIRTYLGISYVLLLTLTLGGIGFIWSRNEYKVITDQLQNLVQDRVLLLANIFSHELLENGEVRLDASGIPVIGEDKNVIAVYIDNSGTLFELAPDSVTKHQEELFREAVSEHSAHEESYTSLVHSEFETTNIYAAAPIFDSQDQFVGQVCILMPLHELDAYIMQLRWLLVVAISIVALIGVAISYLLSNYFSRRFSQAQSLAATVANGDYLLRIPENGPTELRDLSHYLNLMAEKLQEQLGTRQQLLANVAHELARPLAGLQLGIESLRKGAIQDPELADDLLVSMGQTIHRLEGLIDDITLAAQSKTSPIELDRTALAVEPFLQGVATRFWSLAASRELSIDVRVQEGLPPVLADERRLNQIMGNLVDNAIKFTLPGRHIRLSAEFADNEQIRILVRDGGKGISQEEAEHLFEPFYQGDVGRRIKQGMGLGLSIAHQLTQVHGGSLALENHPEGGALAILTLPKADA
mgnify:CR=1 FL=1